ncbi:uncharacterized protein LOC114520700 [Dendronephthya gigantea]|uniref:uncharacterized protein LOC114520700 n=1 Tax=Dendronephthya gigantea TaxID=151771 RepID=UPI001069591B|nr:uncharacterized protein LOC114520700 [Dendronephthya gigantea]
MATRIKVLQNLGARFNTGLRQIIKYPRGRRGVIGVGNHGSVRDKLLEGNFTAVYSKVVPASSFSTDIVQHCQVQTQNEFQVSKEELSSFAQKIDWPLCNYELLINAITHKSYAMKDNNDVLGMSLEHNERLSYLGYQTASSFVTEILYFKYPTLTAEQLWDLKNGLLREDLLEDCARKIGLHNLILSKDEINCQIISEALLAIIGSMYIDQPPEISRVFVENYLIQDLTEETIKEICQLEHPKFMLKQLNPGVTFTAKILKESLELDASSDETESYKVGIFQEDEMISEGQGDSQWQAEKNACRKLLKDGYLNELKKAKFPLEYADYTSEDGLNLGLLLEGIRVVDIHKGDSGFGFSVKGGEMRSEENKDFVKYNYYFPPFVASVVTGDPAERRGLRAGDVILAINNKNTKGMSHHNVVNLLHSLKGKAKFTVKHSKKVLISDEIERKFGQFQEKKLLSQLRDPKWSKWHHSHLKKDRTEYDTMLKRHQEQNTSSK